MDFPSLKSVERRLLSESSILEKKKCTKLYSRVEISQVPIFTPNAELTAEPIQLHNV